MLCLCRHETNAYLKKPSSSAVANAVILSDLPFYNVFSKSKQELYSLHDIATDLKLIYERDAINSDALAKLCFKKILKDCRVPNEWGVQGNHEIQFLARMTDFQFSSKERPDIIICNEDRTAIALTCEVQSSSTMFGTEQKAILGATNLLRNFRETHIDITSVTVFAIPNTYSKNCVIEIVVKWKNLIFDVKETQFREVLPAIKRIKDVIKLNCSDLPRSQLSAKTDYFIKLSPTELALFAAPQKQLLSQTHLVIKSGDTVFKVLYQTDAAASLRFVMRVFADEDEKPQFVYKLKDSRLKSSPMLDVISYKFLKFDHLHKSEAKSCCREFVEGIKIALDELHDMGISHNDVRLENMLFNANYVPTLIDLDRAQPVDVLFSYFNKHESCMYSFPADVSERFETGIQTDYYQLGWLVAAVLTKEEDANANYHNRKWNTEPAYIRSNKFIASLIEQGMYNPSLLNELPPDTKTIQQVLEDRL